MKRAEAAPKPRRDAVGEQVSAVQAAFRSRSPLPVVIATRTLAAGIDLCAHTVILHGWQPTSAGAVRTMLSTHMLPDRSFSGSVFKVVVFRKKKAFVLA